MSYMSAVKACRDTPMTIDQLNLKPGGLNFATSPAMITAYSDNVLHLASQRGSRLRRFVDTARRMTSAVISKRNLTHSRMGVKHDPMTTEDFYKHVNRDNISG